MAVVLSQEDVARIDAELPATIRHAPRLASVTRQQAAVTVVTPWRAAAQVDRVDELAFAAQGLAPAQLLAEQVDGVKPGVFGLGRGRYR
jgi:hypothetical protein